MANDRADAQVSAAQPRKLSDAIRDVKNAAADREDVVVELREATKIRLQLLADELAPVFADVPADIDSFDFAISSGLRPRLWIDAVSHIAMGRDHRTYRFVRDTRNGRVVLGESPKIDAIADQVTRYIAERIVEREQAMEGGPAKTTGSGAEEAVFPGHAVEQPRPGDRRNVWTRILSGAWVFIAGFGFGLAVAIALLWERLTGGLQ